MAAASSSSDIRITRVYDAPLRTVWDAWTVLEQIEQWWGPRGFTVTTHSKELRAGGSWRYTMHGPDGVDYPNIATYLVVEPCKTLVYDHGATEDRPPLFRVTVRFSEADGRTTMEMTSSLSSPEAAADAMRFIKQAGGTATWDRLAEFLTEEASERRVFVSTRLFHAPLDTLFQMWTHPEHVSAWLPPTGFTMAYLRADIRTGGSSFFRMTNGTGTTMYGRVDYEEVTPPDRLVYVQSFRDEHEALSHHPHAPTWPASMRTQVTLTPDGPHHTRVRIEWEPFGDVTPSEVEAFAAGRAGMTAGWAGSFDKLDALLAQRQGANAQVLELAL